MLRLRLCWPLPQVLVQVDQAFHADTSQWTGQGPSEHAWLWLSSGQATPPCAAAVVTWRERVWVPAAQVLEHSDQEVKEDTTQSIGQAWTLHCCWEFSVGHATPPKALFLVLLRSRVLVPAPHDFVHGDQALHSLTRQSRGHEYWLHPR